MQMFGLSKTRPNSIIIVSTGDNIRDPDQFYNIRCGRYSSDNITISRLKEEYLNH